MVHAAGQQGFERFADRGKHPGLAIGIAISALAQIDLLWK